MFTLKALGLFSFDGKLDSELLKDISSLEFTDEGVGLTTDSVSSTV